MRERNAAVVKVVTGLGFVTAAVVGEVVVSLKLQKLIEDITEPFVNRGIEVVMGGVQALRDLESK